MLRSVFGSRRLEIPGMAAGLVAGKKIAVETIRPLVESPPAKALVEFSLITRRWRSELPLVLRIGVQLSKTMTGVLILYDYYLNQSLTSAWARESFLFCLSSSSS